MNILLYIYIYIYTYITKPLRQLYSFINHVNKYSIVIKIYELCKLVLKNDIYEKITYIHCHIACAENIIMVTEICIYLLNCICLNIIFKYITIHSVNNVWYVFQALYLRRSLLC